MPRAKPETQRVTVAQAAKELGLDPCSVRIWIKTGQLPIGRCIKRPGGRRASYLIYRDKLDMELGRRNDEEGAKLRGNG